MESKKKINYSPHEMIDIQDEFSKDHIDCLEKALKEKRNNINQNSKENSQ